MATEDMFHSLAPVDEQNRISSGEIKIEDVSYIPIERSILEIAGETRQSHNRQDKLGEGLIRVRRSFYRSEYYSVGSIDRIAVEPCFVAGVVYGDTNAWQVHTLREFRDDVLMENRFGRALADFYYGGAGRTAAGIIRDRLPFAIPAIRGTLDSVVERYLSHKE